MYIYTSVGGATEAYGSWFVYVCMYVCVCLSICLSVCRHIIKKDHINEGAKDITEAIIQKWLHLLIHINT